MEEVKLHPPWKQAVRSLLAGGLTYGGTVTKDQIVELCDLKRPLTMAQKERFDLRVMSCVHDIKEALLTHHQMLLATNRDGSYRVLAPGEQTQYAVEQGAKAIAREMQRMAVGVLHVNHGLLNSEQRRKNSDAQAKISMLAGMQRHARSDLARIVNIKTTSPDAAP